LRPPNWKVAGKPSETDNVAVLIGITVGYIIIKMAERTQIQLQAGTHMFFSHAVPVQRSRSARLRLENARRS
jgi:hypothetical protein